MLAGIIFYRAIVRSNRTFMELKFVINGVVTDKEKF